MVALIAAAVGADFFGGTIIGGAFGIGFYYGREVAQAERKAGGEPWWCGFDFRNWSTDSIADLIVPIGACVLVSTFARGL